MIKISEVIIVEGKYDKNALKNIVDATIIETSGFGIFSDKDKLKLIRRLADKRGVIILTDSDSGGFLIRNHLKGMLSGCNIKNAFIPDIYGKEKRKPHASKEGKLGVEGMSKEIIEKALQQCISANTQSVRGSEEKISKADLYKIGLSGVAGSREKRRELLKKLDLPENLSPNALLEVLNALYSRNEFMSLVS